GQGGGGGVAAGLVVGRWPDVAGQVEPADLVVCGHVLYNVPDIGPFATELTRHARRQVVVELTEHHPLTGLNPLWLRFHGLQRPTGPTADDAVRALRAIGLDPEVHRWTRPPAADHGSFDDLVQGTRPRLCRRQARGPPPPSLPAPGRRPRRGRRAARAPGRPARPAGPRLLRPPGSHPDLARHRALGAR